MDDFKLGTTIVDLDAVKMKLSYRDLLLLLGILVALIIGITTLVYKEGTSYGREISIPLKSNLTGSAAAAAKKLLEKADLNSIFR